MSKATNTTTNAKRASKAKVIPTNAQLVSYSIAAFRDYLDADASLQNVKALFDAARKSLRIELARAHEAIAAGKAWDAFKADLRAAMVKAGITSTVEDAGRLINNALIALKITGKGASKGGRKPKEATGEADNVTSDAPNFAVAALAYIADAQSKHAGDDEMLEVLGEIAAILTGTAK